MIHVRIFGEGGIIEKAMQYRKHKSPLQARPLCLNAPLSNKAHRRPLQVSRGRVNCVVFEMFPFVCSYQYSILYFTLVPLHSFRIPIYSLFFQFRINGKYYQRLRRANLEINWKKKHHLQLKTKQQQMITMSLLISLVSYTAVVYKIVLLAILVYISILSVVSQT